MDEATGNIAVDMGLRTQEKQQLERWMPNIIDYLDGLGLGQSADDLRDATITYEPNEEGGYRHLAETTTDEWRSIIGALQYQDGQDAWWLRKKLSKRFHDRVSEIREQIDAD